VYLTLLIANNLGSFGRWTFEEFNDVYDMDKEFRALIDRVLEASE